MLKKLLENKPLVIAGPCSVESEEQVFKTVERLAKQNVHAIRGGIWKPRTRPGSFEGVGETGLKWLKLAKEKFKLPLAIEVANASHVEKALEYDIDILWIGARTTVNPFSVQEIADALKGTKKSVLVKNPINPDLSLWLGAIERIEHSGINEVGAIHRGFSAYGKKEFRNPPIWNIPIELKRLRPDLPLLSDPSHICGTRKTLGHVSQMAFDFGFEGLIVESHYKPEIALSDSEQQLTPENLGKMLSNLITRKLEDEEFTHDIENIREKINHLDERLIEMLSNRMELSAEIGEHKRKKNIKILQTDRWNEIVNSRVPYAKKHGLQESFVLEYLQTIHKESIRIQTEIFHKDDKKS
jgi:chorismate mutase